MMKHYCFALLAFVAALGNAWAQPGSLDPVFGNKGIKKFSFHHNLSSDQALASVQDASGNLYIAGFETTTSGTQNHFVVKMLPSGKLDPTFGVEGKSTQQIGNLANGEYFYPNAITRQADGKIILAGYFYFNTGDGNYPYASVLRLNADGSLDKNFGNNSGYYWSYYETRSMFTSVVINSNRIFATGGTDYVGSSFSDFMIRALDTTGTPIHINGYETMTMNFTGYQNLDYATCSALDGDILYIGGMTADAAGYTTFGYSAFNTKTLDTIVGRGTVTLPVTATDGTTNTCTVLKVTPNHELLLGGYVDYFDSNNHRDFLLYKINASGQPDFTFSPNGYVTYQLGTNLYNSMTTMLLDGNNVVLAGSSNVDYTTAAMWGAIRVSTSSGAVDGTFSSANISTIEGSDESITSIAKLSNGNYYFIGTTNMSISGTNNEDILVKKVTSAGANVTGFGSGSQANFWIEDYDGIVTDIVKRPDGKFWISGYYKDPETSNKYGALALLNSNGTTDTTSVKGNGDKLNGDVGIINIATLMQAYSGFQLAVGTTLEIEASGTLLVAGTFTNPSDATGAFLIRIGADGTLQSFNGSTGYNSFGLDDCYPHEIIVQADNNILVSGYATQMLAVARFTNTGGTDGTFGSSGVYIFTDQPNGDLEKNYVQMKLQSDGKIVCAGAYYGADVNGDFLVFRLTTVGQLDATGFGTGGFYTKPFNTNGVDFASAVAIKANGQILAGGQMDDGTGIYQYAMLQLNGDGTLDSTFGTNPALKGTFVYPVPNYPEQGIRTLDVENANAIVGTGYAGDGKNNKYFVTAFRITSAGVLDQTFKGQGHEIISPGYTRTARLYNGQLYIIGATNDLSSLPIKGQIARLNLGGGPIIKTTNLKLPDHLNVTYGADPVKLLPVTNSYGPITYSVSYAPYQGKVDPKTGVVTPLAVPSDDYPLQIQAYQAAVPGYTEAYATVSIYILKALPVIAFSDQGGIVGDTIRLSFQTKADTSGGFNYSFSSPYFQSYTRDSVIVLGEGSVEVTLNLYSTQNYQSTTATATIHGYIKPIAPVAADDNADLIQGLNPEAEIIVLANDQAYTGRIVPELVDLDPTTKTIDSVYYSSALGIFKRDKSGVVHYIPFDGLIGSGSINYTITDSRGDVSAPAKITVNVKILGQKPTLKATELVTPNNDGLNDAFVIGHTDLDKSNILKIYDRSGAELLSVSNYKNDWGGTLANGQQVENGIYYYLFKEGDRELKGAVEFRK